MCSIMDIKHTLFMNRAQSGEGSQRYIGLNVNANKTEYMLIKIQQETSPP